MHIDQPIGGFCSESEWMLSKPWKIKTRIGTLLILPGFKSDGASIPKFLWSLVGPRFAPDTFAAALAHDALYAARILCTRREADAVFRDILVELHLKFSSPHRFDRILVAILDVISGRVLKVWAYWAFVRIFGWIFMGHTHSSKSNEAQKKVILFRKTTG